MSNSHIVINRQRVIDTFAAYVKNYNDEDSKVRLKIEHTYRVAGLCQAIGQSVGLSGADLDLAWIMGMLHDVGRFEQLRRYNTFYDSISVNHAHLGCDILFKEGKIRDYIEDGCEDELIYRAIFHHSDYRIPTDYDERTTMYCNILRDADKVDILKVNCDFPLEEIYNATTEEIRTGGITGEVFEAFKERHTILRSLKKTAVDNVPGHISLAFELVYPESVRQAVRQGYLDRIMNFQSDNPATQEKMKEIKRIMKEYISERGIE
ncbi:MAG: HD domain-containing protein [Lachnospiraceae bacterium]